MTTETVDMGSYKYADRPAGSLHKAKDPETFIQFYLGSMGGRPPAVFELYQTENVIPTSSMEADGQITMYFPEGSNIRIIDGVNPEALNIQFVPGPEEMYEWADLKSAKIQVNRRYLITADEAGAEPLSTYQPGDRLTLEDKSAKGTAVIDGIRYSTSKRDEVRLGFEDYLHLNGKHSNCVFSLRLPLGEHGEALEKMSSLVLGELTLSIKKSVPEVQVVICAREDDHLVVQEIMDGKYYDTRKISIRKDDSGNWKETPDYWYLIITRDNKIKYEFGRFCCGISDES